MHYMALYLCIFLIEGGKILWGKQIRVFPGEESGYIAECIDLPVVSQGQTIDAALANVRKAIELHLEGEDAESLGISTTASLMTTLQLAPLRTLAIETLLFFLDRCYQIR
jgi:predicted RNase H-like HicB family nuclease